MVKEVGIVYGDSSNTNPECTSEVKQDLVCKFFSVFVLFPLDIGFTEILLE